MGNGVFRDPSDAANLDVRTLSTYRPSRTRKRTKKIGQNVRTKDADFGVVKSILAW